MLDSDPAPEYQVCFTIAAAAAWGLACMLVGIVFTLAVMRIAHACRSESDNRELIVVQEDTGASPYVFEAPLQQPPYVSLAVGPSAPAASFREHLIDRATAPGSSDTDPSGFR